VTFLTKPEPEEILLSFYRRVRPNPAFWGPIAAAATDVEAQHDGLFNLGNWLAGSLMVYAFLFGSGKILLGDPIAGGAFLIVGILAGGFIYRGMSTKGWTKLSS